MAKLFSIRSSLSLDYEVYNNMINLLTSQKVTNLCCLDYNTSLVLDQPLKLLNYNLLDKEDLENHSKIDLGYIINKLLKERIEIIELFEKTNKERKKLREDNINLLKQIFYKSEPVFQEKYQVFFNRAFLLNYELAYAFLEKERLSHEKTKRKLLIKEDEIKTLLGQIHKLEKKLHKTKENFKEYLITGKLNNDEIITLGLTSNRTPLNQNKDILPVSIDPFQLDFSQDWEKTSLNSTSFNKRPTVDHNYGVVSPQNNQINHQNNFSEFNLEKMERTNESQNLLQETKSKIDLFFKNKDLVARNNVSLDAVLSVNDTNALQSSEKDSLKNTKLEGTMRLLKNISSKSMVSVGSFSKVYNKTNNKILLKKNNFIQLNNNNKNFQKK